MGTKEKLEALKQRKAKIEQELAAIEARQKARDRKEDTRLKVLIGAAMLADAKLNPSTIQFIEEVLQRGIIAPRDREFLQGKGWLPAAKPEQAAGEKAKDGQ